MIAKESIGACCDDVTYLSRRKNSYVSMEKFAATRSTACLAASEDAAMKKIAAFALALFALAPFAAGPASAEQSEASKFLFGTAYNDNVDAIQVQGFTAHHDGLPMRVLAATRASMRAAQAKAQNDPEVLRALAVRKIALHNVIDVSTDFTGSKTVYYR